MVEIYVISKTELINYGDPEHLFIEARDKIRAATKEEIESKCDKIFIAYKQDYMISSGILVATHSNFRLPGRWLVDFDGINLCALHAVSSISDTEIELESKRKKFHLRRQCLFLSINSVSNQIQYYIHRLTFL